MLSSMAVTAGLHSQAYSETSQFVVKYIDRNKPYRCVFDFDKRGILKRQIVFNSNGKRRNEYEFTYNRQGDQIQREEFDYALNKTTR
jgi:hypothetical protein